MRNKIFNFIKNIFRHKAIVLMYHRIAETESDVWELCVTPERFEQHLQVLKKTGNVVSLDQLALEITTKHLSKNSIAITFDDGYIDNFKVAKPLLEKYGLPATFFISSANIDTEKEFWWDELEYIILFTAHLPASGSFIISGNLIAYNLKEESSLDGQMRQKHVAWKACTEPPPTKRAELFYKLWQQIKPLTAIEQQAHLQYLKNWAGVTTQQRPGYRSMSTDELKQLAADKLFTVGAHTSTHPALAHHATAFQKSELLNNKYFLEEITGKQINLLAYPYGNFNAETLALARELNFSAGFSTEETTIKKQSNKFSLGRFQVKNIPGTQLSNQLRQWKIFN